MALYNRAEKFFRTMGSPSDAFDATPRQKFKFFVKFIANSSGSSSELSMGSFPLAVSVDLPRVDFETQIVNQYNRKRVIQTGFNYAPINLVFYDTVDKSFQTFYQKYFLLLLFHSLYKTIMFFLISFGLNYQYFHLSFQYFSFITNN